MLQNLVINAGYVTEDDGTIVISAEPVNGNMQVRVTDTVRHSGRNTALPVRGSHDH
ncbi:MAG TPA: hypothetical protein QF772_05860 [Nitrospinaceae bacterium]|nr:hypothetical protein [Nitrospinaceae bacterium]